MKKDKLTKEVPKKIQKKVDQVKQVKPEDVPNHIKKKVRQVKPEDISRLESVLYRRALVKIPAVFICIIFLFYVAVLLIPQGNHALTIVNVLLSTFLSAYIIGFMLVLIRRSFKRLTTARSLTSLFFSYMVFIIVVCLLFSNLYRFSEEFSMGYLTYGQCSDKFDPAMVYNDTQISTDYFYFTTVTLFTVGYGDICPMGFNKTISLFNAFIGNFITAVILVIVITTFIERSLNNKSPESKPK